MQRRRGMTDPDAAGQAAVHRAGYRLENLERALSEQRCMAGIRPCQASATDPKNSITLGRARRALKIKGASGGRHLREIRAGRLRFDGAWVGGGVWWGSVGFSRRRSPGGHQSLAEGASGGGMRGAAAGFCFAACTLSESPIVLRMPADERNPPPGPAWAGGPAASDRGGGLGRDARHRAGRGSRGSSGRPG